MALLKVPSLSRVKCVCNWTTSALGGRKMQPGSVHVQTDKLIRRHGHHLKRFPLELDWKSIKYAWKPPKVIQLPLVESLWDLQGCRKPWSGESWLAVLCEVNLSSGDVCDEGFSARVQDQVQNEKRTANLPGGSF